MTPIEHVPIAYRSRSAGNPRRLESRCGPKGKSEADQSGGDIALSLSLDGCAVEDLAVSFDLRLGDCMACDGLVSLPDKSIDHFITDPPYSERTHEGQCKDRNDGVDPTELSYAHLTTDQVSGISRELRRVARGWALIMTDHTLFPAWDAALTAISPAPPHSS